MTASNPLAHSESPGDNDASPHGADSLVAATRRILEMIAAGASLTDILTNICTAVDAQFPDQRSPTPRSRDGWRR